MKSKTRIAVLLSAFTFAACHHEPTLAERVRARLERLPNTHVAIVDDSTLRLESGDARGDVSLESTKRECKKGEQACASAIEDLVNMEQSAAAEAKKPIERANVRLTLKPLDEVLELEASLRKPGNGVPSDQLVRAPFAGDVVALYVIDMPQQIRILTNNVAKKLGLNRSSLDALAKANLAAGVQGPNMIPSETPGVWLNADADDYDSALLVLPQRWKALADQVGGSLVVSIPARNRVYAASGKGDLAKLKQLTDTAYASEPHAISRQLFAWSASGFAALPQSKP
jgi:uncharacterized protein YtpQ (UPF0354 family)